ncbi:F-box domain-containing protein [Lophiostoma macrostomum CBS 122681]|uniref:F-box domain-containing protein n=1 Tax=Lophiostoma macrostomum CBS 122681 TaxID=1314788 RepID=A0A6A6TE31_9PLEO|nr:F-box domain-containing protein [Lophiostoma macrostomum CBS 122681]
MATRPTFVELPTEILEAIFLHLDPRSLLAVSQTCKLIKKLTTDAPIVWRHFCRTEFQTWDPHHGIATKFSGPLSDVDWRALFIQRVNMQKDALRLLDLILGSQQGRIKYINQVADFGYDVKETLLVECACPDDAEDVLARRYYATAILERIQREMAINVWKAVSCGEDVPLERALGAYDIFARTGSNVDLDIFSSDLDVMARKVLDAYPEFLSWDTRTKASQLASFFRDEGFRGVPDDSYRALRNSFIGMVLQSPEHESLPLISVAIYCALARRLGLDVRPCGFIYHVYCLVYAPKDYSLDGKYKPTNSGELESMYLDPFRSSTEVGRGDLQRTLREMNVPSFKHDDFLTHTHTQEMAFRTARNIINSVQTIREAEVGLFGMQNNRRATVPDMDSAFYASIWAMMILGNLDDSEDLSSAGLASVSTRRRQYLPYLLEHFQTHYPWDVTLLEEHVIPLFWNHPEGPRLVDFVRSMHNVDGIRKEPRNRDSKTEKVTFKVGQLFKHKRYHYEGIVTGWDLACDAGEEWIQHMGVDRLSGGRNQAFYHVLYVAEENIAPTSPNAEPSDAILRLAGRHFRRWDAESHVFVSNIRDEYPED